MKRSVCAALAAAMVVLMTASDTFAGGGRRHSHRSQRGSGVTLRVTPPRFHESTRRVCGPPATVVSSSEVVPNVWFHGTTVGQSCHFVKRIRGGGGRIGVSGSIRF